MKWWSKVVFPIKKGWIRVAKRLGIYKTGLVKLRHDVRTCEYEDVHVLWEMLKKNETDFTRPAGGAKRRSFWSIAEWAKRAPHLFHHGV